VVARRSAKRYTAKVAMDIQKRISELLAAKAAAIAAVRVTPEFAGN